MKGKSRPIRAVPRPTNVIGTLVVTVFNDGKAPNVQCDSHPLDALVMLSYALQAITNALREQMTRPTQADVSDKKREYLGPRETISYGKEGG